MKERMHLLLAIAAIAASLACSTRSTAPSAGGGGAPTVVSSIPAHEATGVSSHATISITFSETMDAASFKASAGADTLPAPTDYPLGAPTWSADGKTVQFAAPPALLALGTVYCVQVQGQDRTGRALTGQTFFAFETEPQPQVVSTWPVTDQANPNISNIGLSEIPPVVVAEFNVSMDRARVEAAFSLTPEGGSAIPCSFNWSADSRSVTCTPGALLEDATSYTLSIGQDAVSAAGHSLSAFSGTFAPNTSAPWQMTVVNPVPTDTAAILAAPPDQTISVLFSNHLPREQVTFSCWLTPAGSSSPADLAGTFTLNASGTGATFTPAAPLPHQANVQCTVQLLDGNGVVQSALQTGFYARSELVTESLPLTPVRSGYVSDDSPDREVKPASDATFTQFLVGDTALNTGRRAIWHFDFTPIWNKNASQLTSVVLVTPQPAVIGAADGLGKPLVESIGTYEKDLAGDAFDWGTLAYYPCKFCLPVTSGVEFDPPAGLDVLGKVSADPTVTSTFRVEYEKESNGNGAEDGLAFPYGSAVDAPQPHLEVTYYKAYPF